MSHNRTVDEEGSLGRQQQQHRAQWCRPINALHIDTLGVTTEYQLQNTADALQAVMQRRVLKCRQDNAEIPQTRMHLAASVTSTWVVYVLPLQSH